MFQTGTPINPQLLSNRGMTQGMLQKSAVNAQVLADLGARVGETIKGFQENQAMKKLDSAFAEKIKNDPTLSITLLGKSAPMGTMSEDGSTVIPPSEESIKEYDKLLMDFNKSMRKGLGKDTYRAIVGQAVFGSLFDDDDKDTDPPISTLTDTLEFIAEGDEYEFINKDGKRTLVRNLDGEQFVVDANDQLFNFKGGEDVANIILGEPL